MFDVDGESVVDRQERLVDLFHEKPTLTGELWRRLAVESSRFNLGPITRTINVPTMELQLLTWSDRNRVSFEKKGEVRLDGVDTWAIAFEEEESPTLIRGEQGEELFSRGTFWIEPGTGRVVQTVMETRDSVMHLETRMQLRYVHDERLGILVPSRMRERYVTSVMEIPNATRFVRHVTEIQGEATYSNFRRFEVDVSFSAGETPW